VKISQEGAAIHKIKWEATPTHQKFAPIKHQALSFLEGMTVPQLSPNNTQQFQLNAMLNLWLTSKSMNRLITNYEAVYSSNG
jgi:hypothetical protein